MRLKLFINGCESPEDYKLLSTTMSAVASLRETAVLRFNSERLVVISTPKASSGNLRTVLQVDSGQLWCTIPNDAFKTYDVDSAREMNTITMEYNCEYLQSVFKRYERVMNQGSNSDMVIRLGAMPEWNQVAQGGANSKTNPVCVLRITFEEIIHTETADLNGEPDTNVTAGIMDSSKTVMHSFKVPVKLLYKAQDAKIAEPIISDTNIQIDKLPSSTNSFGSAFLNFIRRIERYNNVTHIKLSGLRKENDDGTFSDQLKIVADETSWNLQIAWNGPLDCVIPSSATKSISEESSVSHNKQLSPDDIRDTHSEQEDMYIEDSEMTSNHDMVADSNNVDVQLNDISLMVERAEKESLQAHEVYIRLKDWKVCHKLYTAFEEVMLAISHDESCMLHCSLDRTTMDTEEDGESSRERGQIIYYMVRSKPL